jgi:hypothetical protein
LKAWQLSRSSKNLLGKKLLVLSLGFLLDQNPLVSLTCGFKGSRLSGSICLKAAGRGTLEEMGVPLPRGFS